MRYFYLFSMAVVITCILMCIIIDMITPPKKYSLVTRGELMQGVLAIVAMAITLMVGLVALGHHLFF